MECKWSVKRCADCHLMDQSSKYNITHQVRVFPEMQIYSGRNPESKFKWTTVLSHVFFATLNHTTELISLLCCEPFFDHKSTLNPFSILPGLFTSLSYSPCFLDAVESKYLKSCTDVTSALYSGPREPGLDPRSKQICLKTSGKTAYERRGERQSIKNGICNY